MGLDEVYEADFRRNLHFKTFPIGLDGSRGQVWGPGGRNLAFNLELRIEVARESLPQGPTVHDVNFDSSAQKLPRKARACSTVSPMGRLHTPGFLIHEFINTWMF